MDNTTRKATRYVTVNGINYNLDNKRGLETARAALRRYGALETVVWLSPRSMRAVNRHGDPDAVLASYKVSA